MNSETRNNFLISNIWESDISVACYFGTSMIWQYSTSSINWDIHCLAEFRLNSKQVGQAEKSNVENTNNTHRREWGGT